MAYTAHLAASAECAADAICAVFCLISVILELCHDGTTKTQHKVYDDSTVPQRDGA